MLLLIVAVGACTGSRSSPYPKRATLPSLTEPYQLPTERCGGYFVVQAMLNGHGPYALIMDTGAGQTVLDPSVIREAGLNSGIDSLRIGEYRAESFGFGRLDTDELSSALGLEIDGILGHPVFGGVLLTYDFPRGSLWLEAGALPEEGEGVVRARENRRPFVGSVVQQDTSWILIDSGSSRGLTLQGTEDFTYLSPPEVTGARVRVDGVHLVESGRLEGIARVGPMRVDRPVVSNSVSVNLVGQEVLRHFRITFDQANDRMLFERPDTAVSDPVASPAVRATGFALRPDRDAAEVFHLMDAAPPGMRVGDRVVAINGTPWSERGCSDPDAAPVADTLLLTVTRGRDTLTIEAPTRLVHRLPGG